MAGRSIYRFSTYGHWMPVVIKIRGVTGDGIVTTTINTLKRLDDNAYAWQSIEGNWTPPAAEPVE